MSAAATQDRPTGEWSRLAVTILLAAVSVIPILVMISTSFKTQRQIFDGDFSLIVMPTFDNYRAVLEGRFLGYLGNSVVVSIAATGLTLMLGTMCAYAMSRFDFLARAPIGFGTVLLRTIPPAVLAIPVYFIFVPLRLDGLTGLVIAYVALNLPFTIWLLYGFIEQVPEELEEAAVIDGCGPYRLFFTVILPLLKPGLAAAAIFTFRIAWNELVLASVLTNRTTRTLPYAVYLFITDVGIDWGRLMAAGTLVALPPLLFTFVAARQIITGLTAGAVKG